MATSTIIIRQESMEVSAIYAGRNEIINDEQESIIDNVRNILIGLGAKLGGSRPQWQALVTGIVNEKQ